MQQILRGDCLRTDTRFRKRDILRNLRVQVMANHEHVQVLIDRVDGEWARRIGGRWEHIRLAGNLDDVGRMTTTGAFAMICVNGASFKSADRVFDKARFVQGIRVDGDLDVEFVGNTEAAINRGRGGAPIFVQLQPNGSGEDLLPQRFRSGTISFSEETE